MVHLRSPVNPDFQVLSAYHGGGAIKGHKRELVFFDCPKYKKFRHAEKQEGNLYENCTIGKNHHGGGYCQPRISHFDENARE